MQRQPKTEAPTENEHKNSSETDKSDDVEDKSHGKFHLRMNGILVAMVTY